jgi:hypothetical protein
MVFFFIAAGVVLLAIAWRGRSYRSQRVVHPAAYPPVVRPVPSGHSPWSTLGVLVVLFCAAGMVLYLKARRTYEEPATVAMADVGVGPDVRIQMRAAPDVRADRAPARQNWMKKPKASPAPAEPAVKWQGIIEQHTFSAAPEVNSQTDLLEKVGSHLQRQLQLRKVPNPQFVGNPAWVRIAEMDRETHEEKDPKYGEVVTVRYAVELTQQGWSELGREQRAERAGSRLEFAARGLGLLTVLLGAVAGYIRVDEWTKGYYSGRLFLGAAALTVVLGAMMVVPW